MAASSVFCHISQECNTFLQLFYLHAVVTFDRIFCLLCLWSRVTYTCGIVLTGLPPNATKVDVEQFLGDAAYDPSKLTLRKMCSYIVMYTLICISNNIIML